MESQSSYEFVKETSNKQKIRFFSISVLLLIILIIASFTLYSFFKDSINKSPSVKAFNNFIDDQVVKLTPIGLFYLCFIGSLFFLFAPLEAFFFLSLKAGSPIMLSLLFSMTGIILAHLINYFVGLKFGNFILNFMSKKKVYQTRRKINKYGIYTILIFNILPLPSDVLTFGLGITRYNILRLFVLTFIGNLIKFTFIVLSYKGIF